MPSRRGGGWNPNSPLLERNEVPYRIRYHGIFCRALIAKVVSIDQRSWPESKT